MRNAFAVCFVFATVAAFVTPALAPLHAPLHAQRPTTMAGRSTVYAPNGMVAASQPLASSAVLSVTEPHMTGIGGDMFAVVWLAKEQKLVAINASGRAGSLMARATLQAQGGSRGQSR